MQIREFIAASDSAAIERCFEELQDFSRIQDVRIPVGSLLSAEYLQTLVKRCELYRGQVFVADQKGEILGYVCVLSRVPCAEPADGLFEEAQIVDLIVTQRARGTGLGKRLLKAAEDFAAMQGATWLRVSVFAWNAAARSLYTKQGFSELEVTLEKQLRVQMPGEA